VLKLQHQKSYFNCISTLITTNTDFFRAPAGNCPTKYEYKSAGEADSEAPSKRSWYSSALLGNIFHSWY